MIKICPQCGNEFESKSKWGDEKKFCSISCSNRSRIMTDETKEKISKSVNLWNASNLDLLKNKFRKCKICGKKSHKTSEHKKKESKKKR